MLDTLLQFLAAGTCIVAAIMVALNLGSRVTGYGFVVFVISSIAWVAIGWEQDQPSLIVQNAVLLVINVVGVWRWLGLKLRYERGAWNAVWRSRRVAQRSSSPGR
jgi:uncharacterized membrane protein YphA (DoxX/SURF4 family)